MIYSVSGKLIHTEPGIAVIECAGVGYQCNTSLKTLAQLPRTGGQVTLFTYLNVREDAVELFGFAEMSELSCFKMLRQVSGVGPKVALAILSDLTPEKVALCIATNDAKTLTRAQGVGPKLAQRLVLELKDKVKNSDVAKGVVNIPFSSDGQGAVSNLSQAIDALLVLGYSQSEAGTALSKLDESLSVEELIKGALKALASSR